MDNTIVTIIADYRMFHQRLYRFGCAVFGQIGFGYVHTKFGFRDLLGDHIQLRAAIHAHRDVSLSKQQVFAGI